MRVKVLDTLPRGAVANIRDWLLAQLDVAGYRLTFRPPGSRRSWANPITRRVVLRPVDLYHVDGLALLAHETAHVRQQSGALWYRLAWGAWYWLNPWFRRRVEVEAEAWWTAVAVRYRYGLSRWRPTIEAWAKRSHTLGRWRAPHFTPGDPEEITRAIADRAAELLS